MIHALIMGTSAKLCIRYMIQKKKKKRYFVSKRNVLIAFYTFCVEIGGAAGYISLNMNTLLYVAFTSKKY
jgi:hypothetical protein